MFLLINETYKRAKPKKLNKLNRRYLVGMIMVRVGSYENIKIKTAIKT